MEVKKLKNKKMYDYISKVAIFSAISFILYLVKFPLPFLFPEFLEIQFSNLPALLGGFILGPVGGCIILVIKCILKLLISPSSTSPIGEISDLIIGIFVVLVASLIYKKFKSKKGGIIALVVGGCTWTLVSVLVNWFISIPLYIELIFGGSITPLVNACSSVIKGINENNFMYKYLLCAVLPFNALIAVVVCLITFFVYKEVSNIFKREFFSSTNQIIKTLVICDSFKGSLSSKEVVTTICDALPKNKYLPTPIIISDGGEGFLDAIENSIAHLERVKVISVDCFNRKKEATYLVDYTNKTLYFELAEVVGIKDLKDQELEVFQASTYGLGLLIKDGITRFKPQKIILGIGGSASNDGGSGLLEAMGVVFYNQDHQVLENMCNQKLKDVAYFNLSTFSKLIEQIEFVVLTDVINPLLGPNGATAIYAPQKGAKPNDLPLLEANLQHFSQVCFDYFKQDDSKTFGSGAAGGVGYGMMTFTKAQLKSGIDEILKLNNFAKLVKEYDLVISGEGKLDHQSFDGKVISGIINYHPKRLELVVAVNALTECEYVVHSIVPDITTGEESLAKPQKYLKKLIKCKYR